MLLGCLVAFVCSACNSETTHVEVIASTHLQAPGAAWNVERDAYRLVTDEALRPGWRVIITPITDRSWSASSFFDEQLPEWSIFGMNEYEQGQRIKKAQGTADAALHRLWSERRGSRRTEIIAAVIAASDRFEEDKTKRKVLVILSTAFEQSSIVNMGDYHLNLAAATGRIVRRLRSNGTMPRLRGVGVCMAGVTSGEHDWADLKRARNVRRFWHAFFAASGAQLVSYGVTLNGCTPLRG